jgi:hypothetical protein
LSRCYDNKNQNIWFLKLCVAKKSLFSQKNGGKKGAAMHLFHKVDKFATILLQGGREYDRMYIGYKGLPKDYKIDGGTQNVRKSCY